MILHVIDASNPDWEEQAKITDRLIAELGAESTPRIEVYNKCDLSPLRLCPVRRRRLSFQPLPARA
jgi:GTP-binding protein HflX